MERLGGDRARAPVLEFPDGGALPTQPWEKNRQGPCSSGVGTVSTSPPSDCLAVSA